MTKPRLKESLGTNLLVSFLVCYPELSTLRLDPQQKRLSFTVFLKQDAEPNLFATFKATVTEYFETARMVDPSFPPLGDVTFSHMDGITALVYEQSVEHVNVPAVRLFMQLVCDAFRGRISDDSCPLHEEDLLTQEEIIERILGKRKELTEEKVIVAYREGGRVFVYNP